MNNTISIRDYIRALTFGERAKESGTLVIYGQESAGYMIINCA